MKTILITGASSGIGKATVELLAKENLILVARSKKILNSLAEKFPNCHIFPCDLADEKQVEIISKEIASKFTIDVLVNNAGVGFPTKLDEISIKEYDEMMDTNVKGLIFLTKPILEQMIKNKKGHIINISSLAGIQSNPVAPIYCTSKFALEGYTDGLRMQVRDDNIRVSLIRPGGVDTKYWRDRKVDREKFMTPLEMAEVIKFVINTPETSNVVDITMESFR